MTADNVMSSHGRRNISSAVLKLERGIASIIHENFEDIAELLRTDCLYLSRFRPHFRKRRADLQRP